MSTYNVNPKVLVWAREEAHLERLEAAQLLRTWLGDDAETKLTALESEHGTDQPTLSILQAMSKTYKVSLITLCRPNVPPHTKQITDFRTFKGRAPILGTDAINAMRSTQVFIDDIEDLIQDVPSLYPKIDLPQLNLKSDPEQAASIELKRLNVTTQMQHSWEDTSAAFEAWRWHVEKLGILVFTFKMPVTDCRGFVLSGSTLSAIAVNYIDDSGAQIFTLFHEYAHILLREFGVCGRTEDVDKRNIEKFANNFAANLLMPVDKVHELADLSSLNEKTMNRFNIALDAARTISKYLNVSVEAAILRLERLNRVPDGTEVLSIGV